ncbi:MAG TPA: retropepsin-like aspartic protease [Gaiellaceae bacterium]
MRFPFIELPGELRPLIRPAVPVQIEDLDDAPQVCLLDSGAVSNRLPAWLADAAGLSLDDALAQDEIVVGGARTTGRLLQVELTLGDVRFQAPAWFCDPWNLSFGLLGQEGFFRFFRVTLCAAEGWLECEPEEEGIALVSAVGPLSPGPSGL